MNLSELIEVQGGDGGQERSQAKGKERAGYGKTERTKKKWVPVLRPELASVGRSS